MSRRAIAICLSIAVSGVVSTTAGADDPAETARIEYEQVMALTPDIENGRQVYLTCAVCHRPEGWGSADGAYPQIAGQLRTVIIKQLADIRARNRDNPLMYPFSVPRILGGPQNLADVAAYVAALPMNPNNGVGPGTDLALGRNIYEEHCSKCHGANGDGNEDVFLSQNFFALRPEVPRLDSGRGLWLRGDGQGQLTAVPGQVSGVAVYGEQRGAALGDFNRDARVDLAVTQNGGPTRLFLNAAPRRGLTVRLEGPRGNPMAIGARMRLWRGTTPGPIREVHAGSGYWSQDAATQVMGSPEPPTEI